MIDCQVSLPFQTSFAQSNKRLAREKFIAKSYLTSFLRKISPGLAQFHQHYTGSFYTRVQFHQCSTHSFYVRKLCMQLFCDYVLGFYFTGARLLAQKLSVEHWWNWPSVVLRQSYWRTAKSERVEHIFYLWILIKLCVFL